MDISATTAVNPLTISKETIQKMGNATPVSTPADRAVPANPPAISERCNPGAQIDMVG